MKNPKEITIFEMGPRDGLQNESRAVLLQDKIEFVYGLVEAGLREIELGAFVRPDRVPQMADTDQIFEAVRTKALHLGKARAWSLVPNEKGLERAMEVGAKNIAVFTAATESFVQKNMGFSIDESFEEFKKIIPIAKKNKIQVRGYVSTAFGCPFEGKVKPQQALKVVERLMKLGVFQVSIGDTIGVATPKEIQNVMKPAIRHWGSKKIAGHFHDTRGTALANALMAIQVGVTTLDASAGGLGGCPFAPGATGNLATEDLIYMLDGMGVKTGVSLEKLCQASLTLQKKMNRPLSSRYLAAWISKRQRS